LKSERTDQEKPLPARVIISYDDTANDRDAIALGRLFADAGAEVSLAYVRHTEASEERREELEESHARALLDRGAEALGEPNAARHVVVSASTGEGLRTLAEREHADVVVFGSDYRTSPGTVRPGTSAQQLLNGGPVAVAIAPGAFRERDPLRIASVGVLPDQGDESAAATAEALAAALGATTGSSAKAPVELLVIGSRPEAPHGRVMISAVAEYAIDTCSAPVLVVPRGVTLPFQAPAETTAV
jgi:nucleotide-binding universal stress UspA family protein